MPQKIISLLFIVALIFSSGLPAIASEPYTIISLYQTHRERRSWKWLKLKPGREVAWFYHALDEQGHLVIKATDKPLPINVPDTRPLSERRPNTYLLVASVKLSIPVLLTVLTIR